MNMRMKIAFGCHLLVTLFLVVSGMTYLIRQEFMPYHSVAVGMPWAEVNPAFQALILGFMRGFGGAAIAVAVLLSILLFGPFRQGAVWARWAIPAGGLVIFLLGLYAISVVQLNTPAEMPWIALVTCVLLLVAGLALSVLSQGGSKR
jgi:hypothetical protein